MRRCTPVGLLLLALSLMTRAAGAQKTPRTPPEQLAAVLKEYNTPTGTGVPLTDAERLQFVGRVYRHHFAVATKLLELAERYPDHPIAVEALIQAVWQVNTTPWPVELVGEDRARRRGFELLQRDHIRSEKLGPLCERISFGFAREYDVFLRSVQGRNPHREVQAAASLSLARYLSGRLERVELCRAQPQLAAEFGELYGKAYLAGLLRRDRGEALKEVEAAFTRAAKRFGDVKLPGGDLVRERANTELALVRGLRAGKAAPDIEGEDQDGRPFKLSDYRGKVVLLDFWSFV